jgi:pimeloyl-ACP methyl ester carboxylesterase
VFLKLHLMSRIPRTIEPRNPRTPAAALLTGASISSPRWAEDVTELLPKGQLHVIPRGVHTVNYSLPKEFAAAIIPFLELR